MVPEFGKLSHPPEGLDLFSYFRAYISQENIIFFEQSRPLFLPPGRAASRNGQFGGIFRVTG